MGHFGQRKSYKKIDKIDKDFELYEVFIHNFFCQNVWIFPLYILRIKRIDKFWSESIKKIWSGGIGGFWAQNIMQEKVNRSTSLHGQFFVSKCFDIPNIYCWHVLKAFLPLLNQILLYTNFISKNWFYFCPHILASTNPTILLDTTLIKQIMLFLRIFADKVYHHLLCITHIINIATFLKVMSSSKLSPVSIKTLALSKFSMPNISVLQSYLIIDLAYNHQSSSIFFLHVLQSFVLIHHNAI